MKTIMLTSANYIGNSQFRYVLRQAIRAPDDIAAIAVSNIEFYNMSFNITSSYGNNYIQLTFRGTTYTITFSDGYYSASDINSRIQAYCYLNSLYMTASDGKIVYFVEVAENSVLYKIQLNVYAIPTTAQATTLGYTIPTAASWTAPTTAETPLVIINTSFGSLIGLPSGSYPSVTLSTSQNFTSTITPVISPINSYIFACNLIQNPYGTLSEHMCTVALTNSLGSIVQYNPPALIPNEICSGVYTSIVITLYDQSYNLLTINDNEFNITLALLSPLEVKAMLK
jgi:hypothetical protein